MTLTEYITNEGDRLDLIAYKAYGNAAAWDQIIENNPALPLQDIYPAGIRLIIPIVEEDETAQPEKSTLPPWKR